MRFIGREEFISGRQISIYPTRVIDQLKKHIEVDMERHSSELAIGYVEAYHKLSTVLKGYPWALNIILIS